MTTQDSSPLHPLSCDDDVTTYALSYPPCDPPAYSDVCGVDVPRDDCSLRIVDNQPQIRFTDAARADNRHLENRVQQPTPTVHVPNPAPVQTAGRVLSARDLYGPYGPMSNPPNDYEDYCSFVKWFCMAPIGKMAAKRSAECRAAIEAYDRITAERKSKEALQYANCGLGVGIVIWILNLVIIGFVIYDRKSSNKRN